MQIYRSLDEVIEAGTIAPDSIVNADCLEAMKLIPDKSIDAIITDLPYGVTACKWDTVIPFDLLWEQYKRIIKPNGAIALFGSQPFTSALVMSNPKWFKYEWIWDKGQGTMPINAPFQPQKVTETVLVFSNAAATFSKKMQMKYYPQMEEGKPYNGGIRGLAKIAFHTAPTKEFKGNIGTRYPRNIIKVTTQRGLHPTQKPVALIEYLIKTYTIEGELILDNTAGSGTLAIAAINTNRRYLCIEKDPDYFEVMRVGIENHDPNALVTPKKARKPRAITEGQLRLFG